ncbi:MAG: ribonuclease J [Candidatus Paceibacterota bacterium]
MTDSTHQQEAKTERRRPVHVSLPTKSNKPPSGGGGRPHRPPGNRPNNKPNRSKGRPQQRRSSHGRPHHNRRPQQNNGKQIHRNNTELPTLPALGDNIRIMPLGGVEEVGRNMTAIEIGNDIIILDAGFQFKEDDTPGIDYILPNTAYLEANKDRVRGIIVTHGHLDHIGGIPYIMERIGNPPIYTRKLTSIMIQKRQAEFPQLSPLDINVVEANSRVTLGAIKVRFFAVTHTIPDSMGMILETPHGLIVAPSDYKLSHMDGIPDPHEVESYKIFEKEKVILMLCDSTNVENPGFSTPEKIVHQNLDEIIKNTKGRLILGTFASQLERLIKIIESAERYNKKVILEGRSMKVNIEIAELAGLYTPKKGTIIPAQEAENYPPDRILVLATGAQGEEFAALMRIATKTHKYIRLNNRDTVLLSSSIIPGNEKTVQKLKDNIARQEAKIIHYRTSDVFIHASGHGNREEVAWLHKQVRPKFFIPIHGNHYMLRQHAELARQLGMPDDHIVVPDNGSVIEIRDKGEKIVHLKERVANGLVMVDGFSVGGLQDVVIRDRQMLAKDGMFVIVATLNTKTGKLRKSPDLISRGFVYLRESQDLLHQTRNIIKKTIEDSATGMNPINFDYLKEQVTDHVAKHLFQKTNKHPIVIPVILGL